MTPGYAVRDWGESTIAPCSVSFTWIIRGDKSGQERLAAEHHHQIDQKGSERKVQARHARI
jgi:hypothetical protein